MSTFALLAGRIADYSVSPQSPILLRTLLRTSPEPPQNNSIALSEHSEHFHNTPQNTPSTSSTPRTLQNTPCTLKYTEIEKTVFYIISSFEYKLLAQVFWSSRYDLRRHRRVGLCFRLQAAWHYRPICVRDQHALSRRYDLRYRENLCRYVRPMVTPRRNMPRQNILRLLNHSIHRNIIFRSSIIIPVI